MTAQKAFKRIIIYALLPCATGSVDDDIRVNLLNKSVPAAGAAHTSERKQSMRQARMASIFRAVTGGVLLE
jgi:hypothetical protein